MNNIDKLDNVVLELNGIRETVSLLGLQFAKANGEVIADNSCISGVLTAIAEHLGRIGDDIEQITLEQA